MISSPILRYISDRYSGPSTSPSKELRTEQIHEEEWQPAFHVLDPVRVVLVFEIFQIPTLAT